MKQCEYCGKEISYHEQYCCDECNEKALEYYNKEKSLKNVFGFFNVVCIVGILISCFIALLFSTEIALTSGGVCLFVLGIAVFLVPMPTLSQLKIYKIKKSVSQTKIIGVSLSIFGIILLVCGILNLCV